MNKRFIKKHAPTLLTIAGGIGVAATAIMAVKATPKALLLLEQAEKNKGEELTKAEIIKVAAPVYIPSALIGLSTITCIVGANVLNKRQQAAIASAYALVSRSYSEYRNKTQEMLGKDAEKEIQAEIVKDKYKKVDIQHEEDGKKLFYETYSERYFRATDEQILAAAYNLNRLVQEEGGLSLNVYFRMLGLEETDYGEYVGWSASQMMDAYWTSWVDFNYTKAEMDDGLECYILEVLDPMEGYDEY